MDNVEIMEMLLEAKASKNNTIDLNAYAQGMEDMANAIKNIGDIAPVSNQRELLIAFFDKANEDDLQECINGFTGRVYDRLKGNL